MAQMTPDASFRPVLVIALHLHLCRVVKTYVEPKIHQLVQKNAMDTEKNLHSAQMTRFASFGPVLIVSAHPNPCCGVRLCIEPTNC